MSVDLLQPKDICALNFQEGITYLRNISRQLRIPQFGRFSWYLPVVDAPPPSPYPRANALPTELGGTIPVLPAAESKSPDHALCEAQYYLFILTMPSFVRVPA